MKSARRDTQELTAERAITFITLLVLPIVSFPLGGELGPDWQTGNVTDRAVLHLDPDVTIFFGPLIVIAWFAVLASIAFESVMAERRLTRWLVYSSVPLTLQYLVISSIAFVGIPIMVGVVVIGAWALLVVLLRGRHRRSLTGIGAAIGALLTLGLLASVAVNGASVESSLRPLLVPLFVLILGGPTICFAAALHRSLRLRRLAAASHSSSRTDDAATGVGVVGWLAAYGVAWSQAATKAADLYDELPVEQPNCWVATAAATGHRRIVGSSKATTADGTSFAVNRQLQSLKLAEIVIAEVAPTLHRRLRSSYDGWGRRFATRLSTPLRADLAYVALKPAEWFGRLIATFALEDADAARRRLYRTGSTERADESVSGQISSSTRAR